MALVLAVLGFVLGQPPEERERPPIARLIATIIIVVGGVYAAHRFAETGLWLPISMGLVLGALAVLAAAYLPHRNNAEGGYLALGVVPVAGLLALGPNDIRWSAVAVIVGCGFAAMSVADERASITAIGASMVAAATVLGRYGGDTPSYMHAGVAIGLGVSLLGVLRQGLLKLGPNLTLWTALGVRLLAVGLAYQIGVVYLGLHDAWISMALAVAAGVAVWAAVPTDEVTEPGRSALAFSLARGYGMSLALLLGAGIHLVLGERRALTTCGPLLGLVMYRLFREAHVDASRALDLGQHYALIGFAIGAALPLFPERWWATKPASGLLQGIGGILWAALWAGTPFLAALLLGPKGVVGLVVGVGFSSLFSATGIAPSLLPMAAAAAAGGLASLTYGWLADLTDLSRDEKLHWVLIGVIPLVMVGFALSILGFRRQKPALVPAAAI
jgi:hypothetical protein